MNWIKRLINKTNKNGANRKMQVQFLLLLGVISTCMIGYKFYQNSYNQSEALLAMGIVIALGITIYFKPIILRPFLWIWLMFGLIIGEFTSTIILGIIFYVLFSPITFVIRKLKGKKESDQPKWIMREFDSVDYTKLF